MKRMLHNEYFLLILRLTVASVFIFAGIEKIADPSSFSVSIDNYRLFPDFSINIIAVFLPWLEVFAGILMLFGISVKETALVFNFLLILFIAIVISALARGLNIDCGCFGTAAAQKVGLTKIFENILLLAAGILLQINGSSKLSVKE